MKRISHYDTRSLLSAIEVLNSDISAKTLPFRTVETLSSLIKAEIFAFDAFGDVCDFKGRLWYSPEELVSDEEVEVFGAHQHEHPFFVDMIVNKRTDVLKISDFVSLNKFHKTGIYNEFYREVGVHEQLAVLLHISPKLFITCALSRSRRDFSERDRDLLNMLAPHLTAAFRNTHAFENFYRLAERLKTTISQGLIVLGIEGNVHFASDYAVRLLERYFGKTKDSLPRQLKDFVEHHQTLFNSRSVYFLPPPPLIVERAEGMLEIRMTFDGQNREIVLLLKESEHITPAKLIAVGLTKREAEVLFFMAKGKTDEDIATLCCISRRTVHKHVEHIFLKLGVETRTAAIVKAFELLQQ